MLPFAIPQTTYLHAALLALPLILFHRSHWVDQLYFAVNDLCHCASPLLAHISFCVMYELAGSPLSISNKLRALSLPLCVSIRFPPLSTGCFRTRRQYIVEPRSAALKTRVNDRNRRAKQSHVLCNKTSCYFLPISLYLSRSVPKNNERPRSEALCTSESHVQEPFYTARELCYIRSTFMSRSKTWEDEIIDFLSVGWNQKQKLSCECKELNNNINLIIIYPWWLLLCHATIKNGSGLRTF